MPKITHPSQLSIPIDHATNGDNTLVAAVAGKRIRVLSFLMIASGTVTVRFESGAGGSPLTGQMPLVVNSGMAPTYNPAGWFITNAGEALNMELSAAVSVDGVLNYDLIDA